MAAKGTSSGSEVARRGTARKSAADASAHASFEESVAELESIIERIEQGAIGLEESLRQFRRGDELVKRCRAILDRAEQDVAELSVDGVEALAGSSADASQIDVRDRAAASDGDGLDE